MESDAVYWDNSYNIIVLCNLAIAILIFTCIRWFSGIISHIDATKELLKKDNPAFGISLAGVIFAVTIVLTGAIYGDPIYTLEDSIISVGLYGVIGLLLLAVARIIFDKIALPQISIRDEIVNGNISAAIVDVGNIIASAIIVRTMMVWVDANSVQGVINIFLGFLISQALLTLTTYLRLKKHIYKTGGKSYQESFTEGNASIALRFAGRKIGTAFAITAGSNILVFENYEPQELLFYWAITSVVMIAILSVLSFIANKVILLKVDTDDEVIKQHNVAIGAVQCAIYISLGLLLTELIA
jgi:uncharacterized membrane protein YjfL (UPF0719 family)